MAAPVPFAEAKEFLSNAHLASLLSNKSPVTTVNKWSMIEEASEILAKNGVLSLPVLDEDAEYYGCISVNDVLRNICCKLQAEDPEWTEHMEKFTAEKLAAMGAEFAAQTVGKLQHDADLWLLSADNTSSVADAVMESFHIQDHHVHHRLFICTPAREQPTNVNAKTTVVNIRPGSERVAASGWKVTGVISHTDVVKMLSENRTVLGTDAQRTVDDLELDAAAVFTVPADTPALEAFGFMYRDHVSSLGLTQDGKLVGNLSASDLRGLKGSEFPLLGLSAAEFKLVTQGKGITKEEALAGKRVEDAAAALAAQLPAITVTPSSTFMDALDILVSKHLHRVYVVDDAGVAVSIITLTDILRAVTRPPTKVLPPRVVEEDEEEDEDEDEEMGEGK